MPPDPFNVLMQRRRRAIETADLDPMEQSRALATDIGSPWGAFFEALRGKTVNLGGFGRTKARDAATGEDYDLESGETPPGFTPEATDPTLAPFFPEGLEVEGGPYEAARLRALKGFLGASADPTRERARRLLPGGWIYP